MTLQIVKLRSIEMYRTYDVWTAIHYVMDQIAGKETTNHGWTIDKAQGYKKRMLEQPQFVNLLCGIAAIAMVAPTPALADGNNDNSVEVNVSVTVNNAADCNETRCITNDNEAIEPAKIITETGVTYIY